MKENEVQNQEINLQTDTLNRLEMLVLFASTYWLCWKVKEKEKYIECIAILLLFLFSFIIQEVNKRIYWNKIIFRKGAGTSNGILFGSILLPLLFLSEINSITTSNIIFTNSNIIQNYFIHFFWISIFMNFYLLSGLFFQTFPFKLSNWKIWILLLITIIFWNNLDLSNSTNVSSYSISFILLSIHYLLSKLITEFGTCFSFGEALVISETIVCFSYDAIMVSFAKWFGPTYPGFSIFSSPSDLHVIFQALFLGMLLIGIFSWPVLIETRRMKHEKSFDFKKFQLYSVLFYIIGISTVTFLITPWLTWLLRINPILWGINYLTSDNMHLYISVYWIVFLCIGLYWIRPNEISGPKTIVRKFFHGIALFLFVPALFLRPEFLSISYALAIALMMGLELCRYGHVWPFGDSLDFFINTYLDEKDSGELALTHLYLLFGCALPLWLDSRFHKASIVPYAGLLIIGLGDSMASIVGYNFGRIKWPNSKKSVEGTVAAILSMLLAICFLNFLFEISFDPKKLLLNFLVASLGCFLEAFTTQVDNLFLPIYYFSFLLLIK